MTFEEELAVLTSKCRSCIRAGQIDRYSGALKEVASLFLRERRFRDQIKMLTLSFYIDLSGFGRAAHIDRTVIRHLQEALVVNNVDIKELEQNYFIWIQPDMIAQHTMSVKDSWYLLRLCLEEKIDQAEWALAKI